MGSRKVDSRRSKAITDTPSARAPPTRFTTTALRKLHTGAEVNGCKKNIRKGKHRARPADHKGTAVSTAPVIQNMVFTADFGTPLDLLGIARRYHNRVEFNPYKFASAIFRIADPTTTILLFSTGSVVVTGCKSRWDAYTSVTMMVRMLAEFGIPVLHRKIALQNVVGSANVGEALDTDYLARIMEERGSYERDLFPGLVYRPYGVHATILIFDSGKMVITGCRNEQDMAEAQQFVEEIKDASASRHAHTGAVHKYSKRK
jgi:transcription initiation factor TFIID TATA-box-binding protein